MKFNKKFIAYARYGTSEQVFYQPKHHTALEELLSEYQQKIFKFSPYLLGKIKTDFKNSNFNFIDIYQIKSGDN